MSSYLYVVFWSIKLSALTYVDVLLCTVDSRILFLLLHGFTCIPKTTQLNNLDLTTTMVVWVIIIYYQDQEYLKTNYAVTTNHGVTRKRDNTLKVICNPIPQKRVNTIKGIRSLLPNRIRSQWPIGLKVST